MDNTFRSPGQSEGHGHGPHAQPDFLTPEAAAKRDNAANPDAELHLSSRYKPPKKDRWWRRLSKKQWIIIGVVLALLLAGGGYFWWRAAHKAKPVAKTPIKHAAKPAPKSEPLTSKLSGMPIDNADVNKRPVTAVMIENSLDARPQSGIDQAGVVFEAVAEGGITRFLTLYQDTQPDYIGPVRSVRPYYVQWLMGFDAAVAHAGGSGEALANIKSWGVKDLDQFANSGPYHRVSNRYAPHNLYTSMAALNELEAKKGYGEPTYTGFERKKDAPSTAPTAKSIDFNISGAYYNSHYDYAADCNCYKRSQGGKPHLVVNKAGAQGQIAAKVVMALVMPQSRAAGDVHTTYGTIGSGQLFVFQDGIVKEGTWNKSGNREQFTFKDQNGVPIKLNPGPTWLTVLGGSDRVKYAQ